MHCGGVELDVKAYLYVASKKVIALLDDRRFFMEPTWNFENYVWMIFHMECGCPHTVDEFLAYVWIDWKHQFTTRISYSETCVKRPLQNEEMVVQISMRTEHAYRVTTH